LCYFVPPMAIVCMFSWAHTKKLHFFNPNGWGYDIMAHICAYMLSLIISVLLWIFLGGWWSTAWAALWIILSIGTIQRNPIISAVVEWPGYGIFFGLMLLISPCC